MSPQALRAHPAWAALTPEERAEAEALLGPRHLDALAVAATTGSIDALEPGDLRRWLARARRQPWAHLTLHPLPEAADALLAAWLDRAAGLAGTPDREPLVQLAREASRHAAALEAGRLDAGHVREEDLAGLREQLLDLARALPAWSMPALLDGLRAARLVPLAEALDAHAAEGEGLRGLLSAWRRRADTRSFNLTSAGLLLIAGEPEHEGRYHGGLWTNWTADHSARPRRFIAPRSEDELCAAVASSEQVRVVGGGHSFNASPLCEDTLITLDDYHRVLELDVEGRRARVQAGVRLRDLNAALAAAGLALPVLGSTDAQSLAGLIATDLHGTGRDRGFLSEQLLSLRVIAADGSARTVRPGDPLFHAAIGGLGACGVVAEAELALVPAFRLAKRTAMVDLHEVERDLDARVAAAEHLSFYRVGGTGGVEAMRAHTWERTDEPLTPGWERRKLRGELSDFALSAFAPGLAEWLVRLDEDDPLSDALAPDERLVMPASRGFGRKLFYRHDEIEHALPFEAALPCLHALERLLRELDAFSIIEVRFTPDTSRALIGPGVGRRSAWIELATPMSQDRGPLFARAEELLRAHGGRPHLGKRTHLTTWDMPALYGDRYVQFQAVREAQDPEGRFLNPFTRRVLGP